MLHKRKKYLTYGDVLARLLGQHAAVNNPSTPTPETSADVTASALRSLWPSFVRNVWLKAKNKNDTNWDGKTWNMRHRFR